MVHMNYVMLEKCVVFFSHLLVIHIKANEDDERVDKRQHRQHQQHNWPNIEQNSFVRRKKSGLDQEKKYYKYPK